MQTEFEIKILDIDVAEVESRLKDLGATSTATMNFRRYIYDIPNKTDGEWLRLRTDGTTTTLTYKRAEADRIDGVKELEIEVSDFDKTRELVLVCGMPERLYQENSRKLYHLNGCEVALDSWPRIPTYLEIEGQDEQSVIATMKILQLDNHKRTSKTTSDIYKIYGQNIND